MLVYNIVSYLNVFLQSPVKLGVLMMVWVFSGAISGLFLSQIGLKRVVKTGNFVAYDRAAKCLILLGLIGYVVMGFCVRYHFSSFIGYIFLVIFIGIGSIGYYGLIYMSII